jgi:MFS family permease
MLGGVFATTVGDWIFLVALLIVVYAQTDSALLLGIVGAGRVAPYAFLSLPAGAVADRFDRRTVLILATAGRAALMLLVAGLIVSNGPLWLVIVLALLAAGLAAFVGPAVGAAIPGLVRDETEIGPANSVWASLDNIAFVVGPAVGGLLIAALGSAAVFAVTAFLFAGCLLVFLPLPSDRTLALARPAAILEAMDERTLEPVDDRITTPVLGLVVIEIVASALSGALGVLTVVVAVDALGQGEATIGLLNAALGVGGLLGALGSGLLVLRRGLAPPLAVGAVAVCLGFLGLTVAAGLPGASLAFAVASAGGLIVDIILMTLLQRIVPDAVLGRGVGLLLTIWATAYAVGAFAGPVLADAVGLAPLLVASAVAMALATVLGMAMIGPALRPTRFAPEIARVADLPVFAGLAPARIERALRLLSARDVAAGETIIREGDPADRFFIAVSGRYGVTQAVGPGHEDKLLREMGPGDVFGEIGLLAGVPRTATVTAATDGRLLALDGPDFLELVGPGAGLSSRLLDFHRGAAVQIRR